MTVLSPPSLLPVPDDQLAETLRALNLRESEYQKILSHLGRAPNFTELTMFSALWSEHCCYKHSRHLLKKLPTEGPRIVQGPGENAGVVDVGDGLQVAFKVESHNHPTYVEPYQGAATGVGGILRDIITMNARPVALLNALRFGPIEAESGSRTSAGNRYRLAGAVKGIGDYGNCMGVPTVGGDVFFHPSYAGNPLVNAMAVGILQPDGIMSAKAAGVGNPVLYVGSPTGRDGMGGASFASRAIDDAQKAADRPAVQVGDPFAEKLLLESCLEAFASGCVVAAQDMGAAGLTCSIAEMAAKGSVGMRVDLDKVPAREPGMQPFEYLNSESQERMLMVLAKGQEQPVLDIFKKWQVPAVIIGEVIAEERAWIDFYGERVVDLPPKLLTDMAPAYAPHGKPAEPEAMKTRRERLAEDGLTDISLQDLSQSLSQLMGSANIAQPQRIYNQYDRHVRNGTLQSSEDATAGVIRLRRPDGTLTERALAVTLDGNPRYVGLEPYVGAMATVAEACRNLVVVGAQPLAVTDNLNFGDPEALDVYYQLYYTVEGLRDACETFETPVTGGNVSLYNANEDQAIVPSPVIGMVGLIEDLSQVTPAKFQQAGDAVILFGRFAPSLGGSEYQWLNTGDMYGMPPTLNLNDERTTQQTVLSLIREGLLHSAQDVSTGGLLPTLLEACFSPEGTVSPKGLVLELTQLRQRLKEQYRVTRLDTLLFGETQGTFILSCAPENEAAVLERLQKSVQPPPGLPCGMLALSLGRVEAAPGLKLALDQETVTIDLPALETLWRNGLSL
ncbi:MAG: phosphoribosylformylglycinamidine synthase subunit PurL [Candidatus Melainabacteria bacterium]|nr:phosphoribosylformylglycinamidine synthase subunit PurL [Candidatus Melainabacteria bacterium]